MPYHRLRDRHINVVLPIVHLELQAHEIGQDGRGARLGLDWRLPFTGFCADDWETVELFLSGWMREGEGIVDGIWKPWERVAHGTRFGPGERQSNLN